MQRIQKSKFTYKFQILQLSARDVPITAGLNLNDTQKRHFYSFIKKWQILLQLFGFSLEINWIVQCMSNFHSFLFYVRVYGLRT